LRPELRPVVPGSKIEKQSGGQEEKDERSANGDFPVHEGCQWFVHESISFAKGLRS
jgi:hypothetical protein